MLSTVLLLRVRLIGHKALVERCLLDKHLVLHHGVEEVVCRPSLVCLECLGAEATVGLHYVAHIAPHHTLLKRLLLLA